MNNFCNWNNGAKGSEVKTILKNNFEELNSKIHNNTENISNFNKQLNSVEILRKQTILINPEDFILQNSTYVTNINYLNKNIVSVEFYDTNKEKIYFSVLQSPNNSNNYLVCSDIQPKTITCVVTYKDE